MMNIGMLSTSAGLLSASLFGVTFANWDPRALPANAIVEEAHRAIRQVHPQTRTSRFDDSAAKVRADVGLVCSLRMVKADGTTTEYNYSADLGPGVRYDPKSPWAVNQSRCNSGIHG